jgi:NAD(P)-dependent dehydrogenase (short-subunit alcohol dehydrogenase family)
MKIALVTGGNKGIGFEVCRNLARAGCRVILASRNQALGEAAAERLRQEGFRGVVFLELDTTNDQTVQAAARQIQSEYGHLDILVNNAGINVAGDGRPSLADLEVVRRVLDTNFIGTLRVTQAMLPLLKSAPSGRIVNVSSELGSMTMNSNPEWEHYNVKLIGYNASKSALNMLRAGTSTSNAGNLHLLERALREPTLGNLSGRKLHSDRNTLAVDHHHALRTFPATCFADCRAPFFAVMKVASRKASSQSSNRRWSNIDSSLCQAASQIPSSSHIRSRRQQVEPSGYCSGRSRHLAPVRSTHRIPSRHERFEAQGRPRPSLRRLGSGNRGSTIFHWTSLNSTSRFFCLMTEDQQNTRLLHK